MNEETATMNEEIVEVTMDEKVVEAMDDEIIEQAMNEMMMMNVELMTKIVEFGTVENGELTMNEGIFEKANHEEIAMDAMNENFETKTTSE